MTLREAMKTYGVVGLFGAVVLSHRGRLVLKSCRSLDGTGDCVIRCIAEGVGEVWLNVDNTEVLSTIGVMRA